MTCSRSSQDEVRPRLCITSVVQMCLQSARATYAELMCAKHVLFRSARSKRTALTMWACCTRPWTRYFCNPASRLTTCANWTYVIEFDENLALPKMDQPLLDLCVDTVGWQSLPAHLQVDVADMRSHRHLLRKRSQTHPIMTAQNQKNNRRSYDNSRHQASSSNKRYGSSSSSRGGGRGSARGGHRSSSRGSDKRRKVN